MIEKWTINLIEEKEEKLVDVASVCDVLGKDTLHGFGHLRPIKNLERDLQRKSEYTSINIFIKIITITVVRYRVLLGLDKAGQDDANSLRC